MQVLIEQDSGFTTRCHHLFIRGVKDLAPSFAQGIDPFKAGSFHRSSHIKHSCQNELDVKGSRLINACVNQKVGVQLINFRERSYDAKQVALDRILAVLFYLPAVKQD
jgi:hypothetical protein